MKKRMLLCLVALLPLGLSAQNLSAKEIVQRADDKWQGTSSQATLSMTIVRPTWQRTIEMKNWTLGRDYSLTLITAPAKEKGQSFLKRKTEMWSYSPTIARLIKLPPAMMAQGWMGSDFTNDDMLRESSIVVDYTHRLLGRQKIDGIECYHIELTPLEQAAVVWSRIETWISVGPLDQMQATFFDEDNRLVKTHKMSEIKQMDDRSIPTRIEIVPADEPGHKTIVQIKEQNFRAKLDEAFFSKQNMQRVR